jgi:hypothetical protein
MQPYFCPIFLGYLCFCGNCRSRAQDKTRQDKNRIRSDKRTGKSYTTTCFQTFCLPLLTGLSNLWYTKLDGNQRTKVLPSKRRAELLTPVALAFWVGGDGHYHKRDGVVILSTDSFTVAEVDRLRSILLEKYTIHSTRYSSGRPPLGGPTNTEFV